MHNFLNKIIIFLMILPFYFLLIFIKLVMPDILVMPETWYEIWHDTKDVIGIIISYIVFYTILHPFA